MKKLIMVINFFMLNVAFATFNNINIPNLIDPSNEIVGDHNYYLAFKNGYEAATLIPELEDFDYVDAPVPTRNICISAYRTKQDELRMVNVKIVVYPKDRVYSNGPLFPGTPAELVKTLAFGSFGLVNDKMSNEKKAVFKLSKSSSALIVNVPHNNQNIYFNFGGNIKISFKKDYNGLIFFIFEKMYKNDISIIIQRGYCYNRYSR